MVNIAFYQFVAELPLRISHCPSLKVSANSRGRDGELGSSAHTTRCIATLKMLQTGLHIPITGQDPEIMPPGGSRQKIDPTPRGRLIAAATNLFCQRGINAVGVDAIVEEAGTAKTTLYKLFGSKEHLVEAVLGAEGEAWRDWFITSTTQAGADARTRLLSVFPVLGQWFRQKRFYGCPFINAVAEHDKTSDRLRELALGHKRQVLAFIRGLCVEAGVQDPDQLTHEIALLMDGAIVAAMITKDPGVADVAQHALGRLLDAELAT